MRRPKWIAALAATACLALAGIGATAVTSKAGIGVTAATSSTSYSCTTSDLKGGCGPYPNDQSILINGRVPGGVNEPNPYVAQNNWGGNSAYTATLSANNTGDWRVTANVNPPQDGSVKAYPDAGWGMPYDNAKAAAGQDPFSPVDSFASTVSSWNVSVPTDNGKVDGWAGYDLWLNNWGNEVMIQPDIVANGSYSCSGPTATFSGKTWHLCGPFGSEWVWHPGASDPAGGYQGASTPQNLPSGTIDVKAVLDWMMANGKLPANSTWTAGGFGFEVCETGGAPATFTVNDFKFGAGTSAGTTPTPPTSTSTPTPTATPTPPPTTSSPAPPSAPGGMSNSSHVTENFGWANTGAASYEFQLDTAAGVLVLDKTVTAPHISGVAVNKDTDYKWRVRATRGQWSAWKSFTSP